MSVPPADKKRIVYALDPESGKVSPLIIQHAQHHVMLHGLIL